MGKVKASEEDSAGVLLKPLATLVEIVGTSITVVRSLTRLVGSLT
jgi:hypothetical protein